MKKSVCCWFAILVFLTILAGCGTPLGTSTPPATEIATEAEVEPTATAETPVPVEPSVTPDPCSRPQLETEVQEVHSHMREFDDASTLAGSVPRDQLSSFIADLQRIRREAEDEEIPDCLINLRKIQVDHMNSTISSLLLFVRASDPSSLDCVDIGSEEERGFCQAFALARQQHDEYTLELARVLGLEIVPATLPPAPSATSTP